MSDHETATSAVRNLNGHDVKGRPLRIDLADSDPLLEGKTTNRGELEGGILGASHSGSHGSNAAKQTIPRGVQVPAGSTALDVISNVIASMQPSQLMDIMGHMKVSLVHLEYSAQHTNSSIGICIEIAGPSTKFIADSTSIGICTFPSHGNEPDCRCVRPTSEFWGLPSPTQGRTPLLYLLCADPTLIHAWFQKMLAATAASRSSAAPTPQPAPVSTPVPPPPPPVPSAAAPPAPYFAIPPPGTIPPPLQALHPQYQHYPPIPGQQFQPGPPPPAAAPNPTDEQRKVRTGLLCRAAD